MQFFEILSVNTGFTGISVRIFFKKGEVISKVRQNLAEKRLLMS